MEPVLRCIRWSPAVRKISWGSRTGPCWPSRRWRCRLYSDRLLLWSVPPRRSSCLQPWTHRDDKLYLRRSEPWRAVLHPLTTKTAAAGLGNQCGDGQHSQLAAHRDAPGDNPSNACSCQRDAGQRRVSRDREYRNLWNAWSGPLPWRTSSHRVTGRRWKQCCLQTERLRRERDRPHRYEKWWRVRWLKLPRCVLPQSRLGVRPPTAFPWSFGLRSGLWRDRKCFPSTRRRVVRGKPWARQTPEHYLNPQTSGHE